LAKLYDHDYIKSKGALDSVQALPVELNFSVQNHNAGLAPYFRTMLQQELLEWCKKRGIDLFESGLKIYTTIDSRMQAKAELAMKTQMTQLQKMFDSDWGSRDPWVGEDGKTIENFVLRKLRQTDEYESLAKEFANNRDSLELMIRQPYRRKIFTWDGGRDTLISLIDYVRHQSRFLHTGLLSMDPHSGAVRAWVGGIDHRFFKYDHVRQGSRQAGSTFKLFVYGLAMENGYSPCQQLHDISPAIMDNGKIYQPPNANGSYGDGNPYTLRQALAKSLNSVTMQLMQNLKPGNVAEFAHRLGINTSLDPVYSLGLGTSDVTLYDMVGAYCTFVNNGVHTQPFYLTRIEDQYGKVLEDFTPIQKQVLDPATSYKIVHLLKGGVEEEGGSARALSNLVRDENEIGGKTGTTDNGSDGWFIGVTPNLVTGVWVGGDERSIHFPRWGESSGGRTSLPIWDKYMQQVYADPYCGYRKGKFPIPTSLDPAFLDCDQIMSPYTDPAFE
jgi:penicillin-binding protein 1A